MEAGKLRQLGSPREVFARPANTFVANFIGSTPMNLLPGTVSNPNGSGLDSGAVGMVSVAGGSLPATTFSVPSGAEVTVGVRPEYLTLATGDVTGPTLRGEVVVAENLGTQSLVSVDCDGTLIGDDRAGGGRTDTWCSSRAHGTGVAGSLVRQGVRRSPRPPTGHGRLMAVTSYRRRWTLDDRAESVWHSLPVDIPADCPGLLVTLTVPSVEGAVIDIGCEGRQLARVVRRRTPYVRDHSDLGDTGVSRR